MKPVVSENDGLLREDQIDAAEIDVIGRHNVWLFLSAAVDLILKGRTTICFYL